MPRNRSTDYLESLSMSGERVILNIGGKRFETYVSTLSKYPDSLLGTMFHSRNAHIRKPDQNGEYFFDRSPLAFEFILNFFRTGKLGQFTGLSRSLLQEEIDFWQLPPDILQDEEPLGNRLAYNALEVIRRKAEPVLSVIKKYITDSIEAAASEGVQAFSIEFKESQDQQFYAFLSNFANRELLLHDLLQDNFDMSFNDMTSGQGHSYILFITVWNRFTKQRINDSTLLAVSKILDELRQGVEIKTAKDDHIITTKAIYI